MYTMYTVKPRKDRTYFTHGLHIVIIPTVNCLRSGGFHGTTRGYKFNYMHKCELLYPSLYEYMYMITVF
jgi:hypothetical protein